MPAPNSAIEARIDSLYNLITGEEDARVCRDIPEAACHDQPRNFFAYLGANFLNKVADELSSAKLVLPWMLSALGAPAAFAGFLVPIRESGVLLPQMAVAAYIRHMPRRKGVWLLGAALTAVALLGLAMTALGLTGSAAGWAVVGALVVFSLARGLCSVSAKDVLGKTVSKSRRGALMGYSAAAAGIAVLAIGIVLSSVGLGQASSGLFAGLMGAGALLWLAAIASFALIREQPGATEGGGNALSVALHSLGLLRRDRDFRRFVITRILLLSIALAPPFYVLLAAEALGGGLEGLGLLIVASGLASTISSPLWGRMGDRSSRQVMVLAASGAGVLGIGLWAAVQLDAALLDHALTHAAIYLLLIIMHSGVRLGRKVYLVDLATAENRAAYVAVSNTVIGVAMLAGGLIGILGDLLGPAAVVLLLAIGALGAAAYAWRLPEVE
jgi:hypothetical protein